MAKDNIIEFLRKKDYIFLKNVGQGGTGKTVLIKDEIIDEVFVCKKYSPFYEHNKEQYFKYFIDEIKILHKIYHRNIIRVFSYYLYPEQITGYILMEFIKGKQINDFLKENPDKLNDLFMQAIEGFGYLEQNGILHRDIRPENILVSKNGTLKLIDFGFGKTISFDNEDNSVSLNWRYDKPNEFVNKIYDTKSEIYFLGKLFEEILLSIDDVNFKFSSLLSKMIENYDDRISSFFDIYREIIGKSQNEIQFSKAERLTYQEFADNISEIITKMPYETKYEKNVEQIIKKLDELYKHSSLEENIQNNNKLTSIFLHGKYTYYPKINFKVTKLFNMIKLLKGSSQDKQRVILNNLWERFDKIQRFWETNIDDLPF
jgi:serine/threonine-protein kinase